MLCLAVYMCALQAVSNLSQCSALTELNLSTNALTSTAGLAALVQLKTLDLSCNEIDKVRNNRTQMPSKVYFTYRVCIAQLLQVCM
jgi:Leucine-rich repeat (LRR) protein